MTYNDLLTDHRLLLIELLERGSVSIEANQSPNEGLTLENRPLYTVKAKISTSPISSLDPDFFRLLAASGFRVTITAGDHELFLTLRTTGEPPPLITIPDDDDEPEALPIQTVYRPR